MCSVWNFWIICFFWLVVLVLGLLILIFVGVKFCWFFLNDLFGIKIISNLDLGKGMKELVVKSFKGLLGKKGKDNGDGRYKMGIEKIISVLCVVM